MERPIPTLERPSFFDGQRLTADDLGAAQAFSRELRWLHNRSLHGWGVAVGLAVSGIRGDRQVAVSPGYALDCVGRELILDSPRLAPVPPVVAGSHDLTISYQEDAMLDSVSRRGVCGTEGATRFLDDPLLRWIGTDGADAGELRPGIDVVLCRVDLLDCALDRLSLDERQELDRPGPYIAAGRTTPKATWWRLWPSQESPAGISTVVSTAEAGFTTTPVYQARLAGGRFYQENLLEGHPVVTASTADSFEFAMALPTGDSIVSSGANPLNGLDLETIRAAAADELGWHVVWLGVEA